MSRISKTMRQAMSSYWNGHFWAFAKRWRTKTDNTEHKVGDVARQAGLAVSIVSEHLSQLKRAGILTSRRAAVSMMCALGRTRGEMV